ncbi:metalloprotease TldD [Acidithiobacillus caldus]|uniref:TldD protein, part of proposed TldE/TldD proteolytic complex n=1 Tax=Acidithiobacillus caldus (strain SM-1) TaxID=990288 RepID=F9ZSC7_ACICS|nr:metalloprotease TldD [Acidithiobacillus caldus]AEK59178.1 TldD protein, part of proposed TldE/TldD proteolytic complex [Acidithiobacillus caldus SM-1]AUW33565.1 metalloprotease TldD [Acidithiobacillus caldus]QER43811.1 Peptidase U62, modulator of DNA gyrase [Acidithiobacillus caldus]
MSQSALEIAKATLLAPGNIGEPALERVFAQLSRRALDDADLYFQYSRSEGFSLEEGVVKSGSHHIEQGVGVRAIQGERQGLAYSDEIAVDALLGAAEAARAIVHHSGAQRSLVWQRRQGLELYPPVDPLADLASEEKVAVLERVEAAARAADPRVVQVMASLSARFEAILVARLDGSMAADVRPLVRLNVLVIVESGGRREQGTAGGGGRSDYRSFLAGGAAEHYAREAVRQALVNLEARDAPAGTMDVVLGPGWPGILLHEAIGHGLEGDFNRKGTSAFSGRVGERVAAPGVTVVDDGTLSGRRGSLNVDDEGTPTQCTVLIEDGFLKGYLQDTLNARLMGTHSTGNGRRESYAHLPMPRMTNTYMRAGDRDPREIIASVKKGLYAVNFGGGQVDITNGKFVFSASEAYLIENGRITHPVKGATLIGNGPDVLTRVEMVGNDLALDTGVGTCGKDGQSVPVGVGQPTLKIRDLTVGGTQG